MMKIIVNKPNIKITGTTVIDHNFRCKLGITCEEYVVMDFIYNHNQLKRNTFYSIEKLYKETGMSVEDVNRISEKLIEKKLLYKSENGILYTSIIWNEKFNEVTRFEELWKLFKNRGIKRKGLVNYKKAVAKYGEEKIFKAAKAYLATKNPNQPQYIMGIERFLNMNDRIFEQYFPDEKKLDLEEKNEMIYEGKFGK